MKYIQNPELLTSEELLKVLCDDEAELDCLDSGLGCQPLPVRLLSEQIYSLRRELLLRMGKGEVRSDDEALLYELVRISADSVNSGEDRSLKTREIIDRLTAQVLKRASRDKSPQPA